MDDARETAGGAWPFERKCPECGRIFSGQCLVEDWAYRFRGEIVCSYRCKRKQEKAYDDEMQRAAEKMHHIERLTPKQKEALVRRYVISGMLNEEIARKTGLSRQAVNYYRRKLEEADG